MIDIYMHTYTVHKNNNDANNIYIHRRRFIFLCCRDAKAAFER